ncbi:hypothetical protein BGZ83_010346 [Gryganskiella cystojenkinii]|nr:hypothetical protein BGZ83_010346 [Gryganskiella cystojenkinii]
MSSNGPSISAQVMSTSPFPRFSHAASYVDTGTDIYVFGGVVKDSAQRDMHVIDSQKVLEMAKLAYSVTNERAEHADRSWTQTRQEIDTVQLEMATVQANLDRTQREADHWKAEAQETDLLWQKAKSEHEAMRALLEEDMNASYSPGANSRKHDSIMAITSASSSMTPRTEAANAQRHLTSAEDRVVSLESQLSRKDEALEDMVKEQEKNEVQLGLLRGVMRENGLLADDLIVEALTYGAEGETGANTAIAVDGAITMTSLKAKVQETEKRAQEAEDQLNELLALKKHQEDRIQQLVADYQTVVHYVQGSEGMLQQLRDDAQAATQERDAVQTRLLQLIDHFEYETLHRRFRLLHPLHRC